jgi:hypothetical protein
MVLIVARSHLSPDGGGFLYGDIHRLAAEGDVWAGGRLLSGRLACARERGDVRRQLDHTAPTSNPI